MRHDMTSNSAPEARVRARVHGRVQGVNFRYYTTRTARRLGLRGWVANRRDGTVETIAEGDAAAVEEFIDFLHEGPPAAAVEKVDVERDEPTGDFDGFRVRYR